MFFILITDTISAQNKATASQFLNTQQLSLVSISALAAMPGVAAQLQAHANMGMNTGLTETQLLEAFNLIEKHIGSQQAKIAREVLSKIRKAKK